MTNNDDMILNIDMLMSLKELVSPLVPAKLDIQNTVIHCDQSRTYESGCLLVPLMSSMHCST